MLYTSPWSGFELTTLVVIGTDCIGSCKCNYHTITTMMALYREYELFRRFYKLDIYIIFLDRLRCYNRIEFIVITRNMFNFQLRIFFNYLMQGWSTFPYSPWCTKKRTYSRGVEAVYSGTGKIVYIKVRSHNTIFV
jgi:hypothetical protein